MIHEKIEFNDGALVLRGDLFTPQNMPKKHALLFLHGWTGRPNNNSATLTSQEGYTAMTFSFEGHNNSDGSIETITRASALNNATKAYDFLRQKVGKDTKIIVVGSSFGSYIATLLTTVRNCSDMSLRVPANYIDEGSEEPQKAQGHENSGVTKWRLQVLGAEETKSLRAVHGFSGNIQVIEAAEDELIPRQAVQNYVDACPDPKKVEYRFMKGWPHSLGDDLERSKQFQKILLSWIKKL